MANDDTPRLERLRKQGNDRIQSNQFEAAKALFTQICEISPDDADAWHTLSTINGMLGIFHEAEECCRRTLALQPNYCEAYVNLGNFLVSLGRQSAAIEQFEKALQISPNHAVAHYNLANALSTAERYDEAAAHYQTAIQINPNIFSAYFNLGNLRMRQQQYNKAVNNYARAALLHPSVSQLQAIKEQGQVLVQNNHLDEAKALFMHLCKINPGDAHAWHTLSIINGRLGAVDEAGECCRRVLEILPDHSEAHINLGHVYFHHRLYDKAISQYEMALESNPQSILALNNLAMACQTEYQVQKYIFHYRKAIGTMPDATEARSVFIGLMKKTPITEYDPWLDEELQKYFSTAGMDYTASTAFAAQLLKLKYSIQIPLDDGRSALLKLIDQFATDKLLLLLLENAINTDDVLESLLTRMRHQLLSDHFLETSTNRDRVGLISALAFQGYNNEYVFFVDEEEERLLAILRRSIEQNIPLINSSIEDIERKLLVFGMYESLHSLPCRDRLNRIPSTEWSDIIRQLLEISLVNPIEEQKLKAEIRRITDIEDKTSKLVQSQYEENPYPRWVTITDKKKRNISTVLKQWFPHFSPPAFINGPIQILVAGCGTGKHPIQVALSYENAEILAIDISKSSLAYATRMARKLNVKNIQFLHGDILELSKLQRRFHIVECSGVLHHMEDPLRGWKVLSELLVKNGLMYIGLYSELARKQIVAAREIIKNEQINPDRKGIRGFRARILRGELGDFIYKMLRGSKDFYSISTCRDLLFHFMEHRFTIPQISDALTDLHLEFIGFIFDNAETPNLYRDQFPEDKNMKNLLLWDSFERSYPTTFARMYHLWCQNIRD